MSVVMDRLLGPFFSLARAATARVDFYALYSAVVNTDNGDETCDLTPEDTRLPTMQGIPKLYGVPGLSSTLQAGTKVLLCFQNGDPSRPAIVLYGTGTPAKVTVAPQTELDLGGSGGPAVGRVGDQVKVTLTSAEVATLGMLSAGSGSPITPPASPTSVMVTGSITAGSSKVKAT